MKYQCPDSSFYSLGREQKLCFKKADSRVTCQLERAERVGKMSQVQKNWESVLWTRPIGPVKARGV